MARPKAADYDAQRDAILHRAVAAFAQAGYASATMAELAQACGASKARLYHYYTSKEELLHDALVRYAVRLVRLAESVQARRLTPHEELRGLLRAFMREYRDSRAEQVALLNDVKHLTPEHRDEVRSHERRVIELFARTIDAVMPGRFTAPERTAATMALLGSINFTFAWLRPDGAIDDAHFADLVANVWLAGADATGNGQTDERAKVVVPIQSRACQRDPS